MMYYLKRLLALLAIGAIAYCVWPREASLVDLMVPQELAKLQVQSWKQSNNKEWFGHTITIYKIYDKQYNFPPASAMRVAMDWTRAVSMFRSAADEADKLEAREPMRLAYEIIKGEIKKDDLNSINMAAYELRYWGYLNEGVKDETMVNMLCDYYAAVFGGAPKKYAPAAVLFVQARKQAEIPDWTKAEQTQVKALTAFRTAVKSKNNK